MSGIKLKLLTKLESPYTEWVSQLVRFKETLVQNGHPLPPTLIVIFDTWNNTAGQF